MHANQFKNHSTQENSGSVPHGPGEVWGLGSLRTVIVLLLVSSTLSVAGIADIDGRRLLLTVAAGGWDGSGIAIFLDVGCCD